MFERTIVGFFGVRGKTTTGQLAAFQVIPDTLAADTLPRAPGVAATAVLEVLFLIAFHRFTFSERRENPPFSWLPER